MFQWEITNPVIAILLACFDHIYSRQSVHENNCEPECCIMVVRGCCVRPLARRVVDPIASRMRHAKQLALWKRKCLTCETSSVGTFFASWNRLQISQKTYLEGKTRKFHSFTCIRLTQCIIYIMHSNFCMLTINS